MKKLFLTSGIIACMACPAFADPGFTPAQGGTTPDACDYSHLTSYDTAVTLNAGWQRLWGTITLNEDDEETLNSQSGSGDSAYNGRPAPLYSVNGSTTVYQTLNGTAAGNYELDDGVTAGSEAANVILNTSLPQGKVVTYSLNANDSNLTGSATMPTPQSDRRAFTGFWSAADATDAQNQYIDATGHLTSYGASASSGYAAESTNTWYAQYACATPTLIGGSEVTGHEHEPVLAGYTFQGWNTMADGSGDAYVPGTSCINNTTTLYAQWLANDITITYNCGTPLDNNSASYPEGPTVSTTTIAMDSHGTLQAGTNCTLPGYSFAGWSCPGLYSYTGTGADTQPNDNIFASAAAVAVHSASDITCTAQWTRNEIGLTWTDPSGANTPVSGSCYYDDTITVPANPSRTGYQFSGWAVSGAPVETQQPAQQTGGQGG